MGTWPGIQSSEKFLGSFKPPDYLIDGIIQKGFLYTLTGITGSGKTAVALRLCAHIDTGKPVGKLEVQRGRVLYLAGENPTDVQMRWAALCADMDLDYRTMTTLFTPGSFNLADWVQPIGDYVENQGGVSCIVVDTAQQFFSGENENDNKQMVDYADLLRSMTRFMGNPTVLVPTHPAKGSRLLIPRGGSAFMNAVDGNLTVRKKSEDPYVRLHWAEKFRGKPFDEVKFGMRVVDSPFKDSRGRPLPTVVSHPLSVAEVVELDKANDEDARRLLQALKDFPGASYRRLAEELEWYADGGREPNRSRVWRAMKALETKNFIRIGKNKGRGGANWTFVSSATEERDKNETNEVED